MGGKLRKFKEDVFEKLDSNKRGADASGDEGKGAGCEVKTEEIQEHHEETGTVNNKNVSQQQNNTNETEQAKKVITKNALSS